MARAKALLSVADGQSFTEASRRAGRRSGDAVWQLVARFNREGLAALEPGHGGGQPKRYTGTEQERHPQAGTRREVRRPPDREGDRTGIWSLTALQGALRQAPDGLPGISTYTIWCVLHDAGFTEIEIAILSGQCLDRRIPDIDTLTSEIAVWEADQNEMATAVNWRFTSTDARINLKACLVLTSAVKDQ